MNLELDPQEYQIPALFDLNTPFVGVSGGKRSGKSRMISVCKALMLAFVHPGKPGLVASPIYGMTRRNLLPIFREVVERWGIGHLVSGLNAHSPDCIKIKVGKVESIIWLDCSIENWERLNGLSLAWACVDETDKAKPDDVRAFVEELIIRCSNPYPGKSSQINLTGAPELNGYLAEFFIENASKDRVLYKWSMLENMAISEEYKQRILSTIPESKQAGWVRGEFMYNTDGLVYDRFDPDVHHTNLTLDDFKPGDKVDVCWDINDGGTSAVFRIKRGRFTYYVNEWMAMKDTEAVLSALERERQHGKPWAQQIILSCDPASTQVHSYIHQACQRNRGWVAQIMTKAPEIEWTITSLNNLRFDMLAEELPGVKKPLCQVNTKKCRVLTKCLSRQGYVKGAPDKKTWIEEAKTDISGPIDAMRYCEFKDFPYHPTNPTPKITLRGF